MLHWMCNKTIQNKIINENIREYVEISPIIEKIVKMDLGCLDTERKSLNYVIKIVDQIQSQIIRDDGRPKKTIRKTI